jgi:2Fe-2S ferredoxin
MTRITFVAHDGAEHIVDATNGVSVMKAAIDDLVPGIDADCGGECSCATCHVYVDEAWVELTGSASDLENEMLDLNPEKGATSRLACQIEVRDELNGLVVTVPEFQM